MNRRLRVLLLEPFHDGSHAAFARTLRDGIDAEWHLATLPGRHWKWRMRGAALAFADRVDAGPFDVLFATSFLALGDLLALRPDLARHPTVLYFHENQLAYPSQTGVTAARDHHFGFSQITSALCATACVFNSEYNRRSFLDGAAALLERMPDATDPAWVERIAARSRVLPVPIPPPPPFTPRDPAAPPVLLWNHRWEHDKNPGSWFAALETLQRRAVSYRAVVCGRRFAQVPAVFAQVPDAVRERLLQFGPVADREDYEGWLARADVVVSTAWQEFQGLSVLEAVARGARPLVPDRLAYPEIFPAGYRYRDDADLADQLARLCREATQGRRLARPRPTLTEPFLTTTLLPRYAELLDEVAGVSRSRTRGPDPPGRAASP